MRILLKNTYWLTLPQYSKKIDQSLKYQTFIKDVARLNEGNLRFLVGGGERREVDYAWFKTVNEICGEDRKKRKLLILDVRMTQYFTIGLRLRASSLQGEDRRIAPSMGEEYSAAWFD